MFHTLYHLEDRDFLPFLSVVSSAVSHIVVINDTVLHDDCHDNIEKKQSGRADAFVGIKVEQIID